MAFSQRRLHHSCLQYHDHCFQVHETFPFIAFGIQQRHEALTAARIQMDCHCFDHDVRLLSSITVKLLKEAAHEEEEHQPISSPAIHALKKHVYGAAGKVQESDQSWYQLCSQIWSTMVSLGPPSLWLTINPCDLHNCIIQVLAGEQINLDNLVSTIGPDKEHCAFNVAHDPYAATNFFHFLIDTVL